MNDTTTEINKDTFWGLIREAKDACGQDMSAMMEYLKDVGIYGDRTGTELSRYYASL